MKHKLNNPTFDDAVHFLARNHYKFSFSAHHPPALKISPGELVHVQTWDCYMGAITSSENAVLPIPDSAINGATGPIYVHGAERGDTLSVTLHNIVPGPRGVARTYPGNGQLQHLITQPYARFFDVTDGVVRMNEKVSFPSSPMLGVIGVAPDQGEIATLPAGKHGGNLDNNLNGIGATIHLQVNHPGALLSLGDMHASMGDGEICGTGIEIGGDVLLSVEIIKSKATDYPVTENATSWVTHGVSDVEDLTGAMRIACEEAANLLVSQWGFTIEDAFIFLSVQGNLGIAQAVHPGTGTVIAKMVVPKLNACPSPFNLGLA
ncbi:MAG TPA: acetamidase/formamidase family protein [Candidatus Nanopelagicaceae bacterium]